LGEPKITATVKAAAVPGGALLSVTTFAGVDAADAGIPKERPFAWKGQPDDRLILNGTLPWQPSRFLGAAAFAAAKKEIPSGASMPDMLASIADCKGLSVKLSGLLGCG